MKRIKIKENKHIIAGLKSDLETALPLVKKVYEEFQKLDYYDEKYTLKEIINNIEVIKNDYKKELVKKELPFTRLLLNVDRAIDLVNLPDSPAFDLALANLRTVNVNLDFFEINKGTIGINRVKKQKYVDKHTLYATSEPEIRIWESITKLKDALLETDHNINYFTKERLLDRNTPVTLMKVFEFNRDGLEPKIRFLEALYLKMKKLEQRKPK